MAYDCRIGPIVRRCVSFSENIVKCFIGRNDENECRRFQVFFQFVDACFRIRNMGERMEKTDFIVFLFKMIDINSIQIFRVIIYVEPIYFFAVAIRYVVQILANIAQTAASLIAFHLFYRDIKRLPLIYFALLLTLIPYVCTYYHYTALSPIFTISNLFAVLTVLFAANSFNSAKYYFSSILFSCLSLATYNTSLNVIATLFSRNCSPLALRKLIKAPAKAKSRFSLNFS